MRIFQVRVEVFGLSIWLSPHEPQKVLGKSHQGSGLLGQVEIGLEAGYGPGVAVVTCSL